MPTPSPFLFLNSVLADFPARLAPPPWLEDELQARLVLLLNHILQQEPEATARITRQKGRVVLFQWRTLALKLVATPAGLLDRALPEVVPDLSLWLTQESPLDMVQSLVRGDKPGVKIEGDVQLAAEISWIVEHVRWDIEDDLARVIGDVPAHLLGQAAARAIAVLRSFAGGHTAAPGGTSGARA